MNRLTCLVSFLFSRRRVVRWYEPSLRMAMPVRPASACAPLRAGAAGAAGAAAAPPPARGCKYISWTRVVTASNTARAPLQQTRHQRKPSAIGSNPNPIHSNHRFIPFHSKMKQPFRGRTIGKFRENNYRFQISCLQQRFFSVLRTNALRISRHKA